MENEHIEVFKKEIIGETIQEVVINKDYDSRNNDVSILSIVLGNGKHIVFAASGQIDIDGVWASIEEGE